MINSIMATKKGPTRAQKLFSYIPMFPTCFLGHRSFYGQKTLIESILMHGLRSGERADEMILKKSRILEILVILCHISACSCKFLIDLQRIMMKIFDWFIIHT